MSQGHADAHLVSASRGDEMESSSKGFARIEYACAMGAVALRHARHARADDTRRSTTDRAASTVTSTLGSTLAGCGYDSRAATSSTHASPAIGDGSSYRRRCRRGAGWRWPTRACPQQLHQFHEILNRSDGFTATEFQQKINETRALEGEIARTIRAMRGIRAVIIFFCRR